MKLIVIGLLLAACGSNPSETLDPESAGGQSGAGHMSGIAASSGRMNGVAGGSEAGRELGLSE